MGKTNIPHTMTSESITVIWEGKPVTVKEGAANFPALRRALEQKDWDNVEQHLTIPSSLEGWTEGEFTVKNGIVFYKEEALPTELNARICNMAACGEDPRPLMRFFERLQKNPSWRSVQQLYPFLQHEGIPLTKDGCFLAYKGVRHDYKDKHSGTLDNRPGNVHEIPRNKVSDDPKTACHYGLHVGALSYARRFGSVVVVCKVAPEDVVCIPHDSSQEKMRVCKYKVIADNPDTTYLKGHIVDLAEPEEIDNGYKPTKEEPKKNLEVVSKPVVVDPDELSPEEEAELEHNDENEIVAVPAPKKVIAKKPKASKVNDPFSVFHDLSPKQLKEIPIGELRKYASAGLTIPKAYHIPGGKEALVKAIIKARKKK